MCLQICSDEWDNLGPVTVSRFEMEQIVVSAWVFPRPEAARRSIEKFVLEVVFKHSSYVNLKDKLTLRYRFTVSLSELLY